MDDVTHELIIAINTRLQVLEVKIDALQQALAKIAAEEQEQLDEGAGFGRTSR